MVGEMTGVTFLANIRHSFGYGLVAITTGNNVSSSLSSISTVVCVWFDAVQVAFLIK